ncbi:hybrid sensor histidine kinase/response regulator [Paludibacterium paludis]|uniref:Chemotaxis protein CheA n=1 Tax=Paludibacterium paludis TaxID=1225769 RepID=A0A918P5K7_9NEIS|nr:response regulator [Paludibacterium paludis]GGY22273.1 transcriptional regulator [Paludibacterium paludis]
MPADSDFFRRLRATFAIEAEEHLAAMVTGLFDLEKSGSVSERGETLERIYREAHSLKGAARAVELHEVAGLCHALESVFSAWKNGRVTTTPGLFELLQGALGTLAGMLAGDASSGTESTDLLLRLEAASQGETPAPAASATIERGSPLPMVAAPSSSTVPTIRVDVKKLDAAMRQAEELLLPGQTAGWCASELAGIAARLSDLKRRRVRLQPALRKLTRERGEGEFSELLEFLNAEIRHLQDCEERLDSLQKAAEQHHRALTGMTSELLERVKHMHLQPASALLDGLPRMIRDLAREHGKQAELTVHGTDIEMDRRIIEQLRDPLNHLLRNSIDHGIEEPARRQRLGKPACGSVTVSVAQQDSNTIEIVIEDDGGGIDIEKLAEAANRQGASIAPDAPELAILQMAFLSGVSTRPTVSELSGRGLGLAIVQEKVDRLAGSLSVETKKNRGVRFRLVLPLTLATFRGVRVSAGGACFIIPASCVRRAIRIPSSQIRRQDGRETIEFEGRTLVLARLGTLLGLAPEPPAEPRVLLVLSLGMSTMAFAVGAVIDEQEVLVKGLGPQLARVRYFSGACVLGSGDIVPVLNAHDLMAAAVRDDRPVPETGEERRRGAILVAEDSMTSRALLKGILESAGYDVTTAVDGAEAFELLGAGPTFDLVVSDVEMPRLDGFGLTERIRADAALSDLPVVLVTALASDRDRERGVDAGANAYIVKSSFDQSDLLAIIKRLI